MSLIPNRVTICHCNLRTEARRQSNDRSDNRPIFNLLNKNSNPTAGRWGGQTHELKYEAEVRRGYRVLPNDDNCNLNQQQYWCLRTERTENPTGENFFYFYLTDIGRCVLCWSVAQAQAIWKHYEEHDSEKEVSDWWRYWRLQLASMVARKCKQVWKTGLQPEYSPYFVIAQNHT